VRRAVASELSAVACDAVLNALSGKARSAYDTLSGALARLPAEADQRQWVHTRLARMALRFGDGGLAEGHFRQAMAAGGPDGYVVAAYADYLLDAKRPAQVVALLKNWTRSDILLLRLALAESALGASAARELHPRAAWLRARPQAKRQLSVARRARLPHWRPMGHRGARSGSRDRTRLQWRRQSHLGRTESETRAHRLVCAGASGAGGRRQALPAAGDRTSRRQAQRRGLCGATIPGRLRRRPENAGNPLPPVFRLRLPAQGPAAPGIRRPDPHRSVRRGSHDAAIGIAPRIRARPVSVLRPRRRVAHLDRQSDSILAWRQDNSRSSRHSCRSPSWCARPGSTSA